jgi:putative RecB family exonuclease
MNIEKVYPKNLVLLKDDRTNRPRFSLTTDILSFRKCSRQYGYFGNDGFIPAKAGQMFFGQIVHQVLDKCHLHYQGKLGFAEKTFPTDLDIKSYFEEVSNALRSHGIKRPSKHAEEKALDVICLFNKVEGPTLYPLVIDTEFRLESERDNYVLRGVVDVIAESNTGEPEIWDYKGSYNPGVASDEMQDYIWQMSVYAELYKVKTGVYPVKAVLYFVNELSNIPSTTQHPKRAREEINFMEEGIEEDGTPTLVKKALIEFDKTASDIIKCKKSQEWSTPTGNKIPDENTCDICDIRWNCKAHDNKYPLRNIFV